MNLPLSLSPNDVQKLTESGSPALLHMVGRAFGLGQAEREALSKGSFPGWFWAVSGLVAGFVVGVQVYRRWPSKVPGFIVGKGK